MSAEVKSVPSASQTFAFCRLRQGSLHALWAESRFVHVTIAITNLQSPVQLEGIALDPDAENGVASIGAMDANNLAFTQTQQATQASQARSSLHVLCTMCCLYFGHRSTIFSKASRVSESGGSETIW